MKRLLLLAILSTVIILLLGCKKEDEHKPFRLIEKEKQLITSSYEEIDKKASKILLEDGTADDFEKLIPEIQVLPMIEKAWVEGNTLWVKFKKGGMVSWYITPDEIIPPYIEFTVPPYKSLKGIKSGNKPSNNKVCLINQQYGDDGRPYCKEIISILKNEFLKNEFEVTIKNGKDADVFNFFQKDLNKYGTIFCINHGMYGNGKTWLFTGQEYERNFWDNFLSYYYYLWTDLSVSIGNVEEKRNGKNVIISYYIISDGFIETQYKNNSFPNSLIYWVACQGMKSDNLGKILSKKGAGVTIGWDETNCLGQTTGMMLFQSLLGGYSVQDAFDALPTEAKNDDCSVTPGARLVYYPNSGGNMYLVDSDTAASISVYNPIPGITYQERVQNLSGVVNGFARITKGRVEINEIATTLTKTGNTSFSQPIVINQGENRIKISCEGENESGKTVFASTELTIFGDFPPLPLFTELRWNTNYSDVDFHLLPPNSSITDLWTNKDCYYRNMTTSWGAHLDVDDVNGYGPEHIEIPNTPSAGIYTLYVHYYATHGAGTTLATVNVSANNGDIVKFGPYKLENDGGNRAGDVWAVCTIEYPSGIITPLNQYYYLGRAKSSEITKK